jgi:hypothetical protein
MSPSCSFRASILILQADGLHHVESIKSAEKTMATAGRSSLFLFFLFAVLL